MSKHPVILIPGTWRGAWAENREGTVYTELTALGYEVYRFRWSGDVDGIPSLLDAEDEGDSNADWRAAGWSLRYFLRRFDLPADVIVHSHGIAPVIYQATLPAEQGQWDDRNWAIPIRTLISICSPSREDLQARSADAVQRGLISHWTHIYAMGWDFWARAGELFDGHWGWRRKWPAAHTNVGVNGIGHSKILNDPQHRRDLYSALASAIEHVSITDAYRLASMSKGV